MNIHFVTGNSNKFKEAQAIIPDLKQTELDLIEIQSLEVEEVIKHKLKEAMTHTEGAIVVEETGIYLEGTNGLPGALTKWFLNSIGVEGIVKFAKDYSGKVSARTVVGYFDGDNINNLEFFVGEFSGQIVDPRGDNGFDWDKIVEIDSGKTIAELSLTEKNKISSRKIAFQKLSEYLAQ